MRMRKRKVDQVEQIFKKIRKRGCNKRETKRYINNERQTKIKSKIKKKKSV